MAPPHLLASPWSLMKDVLRSASNNSSPIEAVCWLAAAPCRPVPANYLPTAKLQTPKRAPIWNTPPRSPSEAAASCRQPKERDRGVCKHPREAGEASELNSQNGSRALIGRRHSRTWSGQFGNSLGGPGGARREVPGSWKGSPSRGR